MSSLSPANVSHVMDRAFDPNTKRLRVAAESLPSRESRSDPVTTVSRHTLPILFAGTALGDESVVVVAAADRGVLLDDAMLMLLPGVVVFNVCGGENHHLIVPRGRARMGAHACS